MLLWAPFLPAFASPLSHLAWFLLPLPIQADEQAAASVGVTRESCLIMSTQISKGPHLGKAGVDRGGRRRSQTLLPSPAKLLVPAPKCEGARDFAEMVEEFLT